MLYLSNLGKLVVKRSELVAKIGPLQRTRILHHAIDFDNHEFTFDCLTVKFELCCSQTLG